MWCNGNKAAKNSLLQLPNQTPIHQIRNNGQKGGSVALFVHNSLDFKIQKKQNINSNQIKFDVSKLLEKNVKNIVASL